ncbi:MAG: ribosome silencing factor [Actinomycetes bacterium]
MSSPDLSATDTARVAARAADAKGATDVVVLDVGDLLGICECFVVASASNPRLVRAVVDEVEAQVRAATGRSPRSVEGAAERRWVLMDFGDVVVHVFAEEEREYYRIERLYAEAPTVDWQEGVPG